MSEYQYYEFRAIDRPLTAKEQAEIQKLSSRVEPTPTQAIFVYNYGDFRGKPKEVLTQYFDIMFYIASWGTYQLMFRFLKKLVDPAWFEPYHLPDAITVSQTDRYLVLDINIYDDEGGSGWIEAGDWLPRLLPLRDDLLAGDVRLLYLAWLRGVLSDAVYDLEDDPIEPPIPLNLGKLSQPLKAFVELVELDTDLVAAAAQASPTQKTTSKPALEDFLSELSAKEQREFLLKLLRREPHVDLQLISRLKELAGTVQSVSAAMPGTRRFSELDAIAQDRAAKRNQKAKIAARKAKNKRLEALSPKESELWQQVEKLIALKQAKPYDQATALLQDLHDLAQHQGKLPEFSQRLNQLKSDHSNRPALIRRLDKIKP